jgi:hypothetical protein
MVSTPGTVRFPAAYDDLDSLIRAANGAQTQINMAGGLSAAATTLTVLSTSAFAASGTLSIDSEILAYTGTTATTFTGLSRGIDGTAAAAHAQAATVSGYIAAIHHNVIAQALVAIEQVAGVLAAVGGAAAGGGHFTATVDYYGGGTWYARFDAINRIFGFVNGGLFSCYSDAGVTVTAQISAADGHAIFQGPISIGAGAGITGYSDAARTTPAWVLGSPAGLSGFYGLTVLGSASATTYTLVGNATGTDVYLNRPTGGSIHIRENNSAAGEVLFQPGGGITVGGTTGGRIRAGAGSPQSVVIGSPGDLWLNTSGGAAQTLWVKETGAATNTGWVAK